MFSFRDLVTGKPLLIAPLPVYAVDGVLMKHSNFKVRNFPYQVLCDWTNTFFILFLYEMHTLCFITDILTTIITIINIINISGVCSKNKYSHYERQVRAV